MLAKEASTLIGETALTGSTFLVRIVFLRALAFVYGAAFLVAHRQNKALIGDDGITPARRILDKAEQRGRNTRQRRQHWMNQPYAGSPRTDVTGFVGKVTNTTVARKIGMAINRNPTYQRLREVLWDRADAMGRPVTTLLWLAKDRRKLNPWLDGISLTGLALAALVFSLGAANVPILLALWLCQRSLMAVGGTFYGYGWEPQLAETGFHVLFLVPLLSLDPIPSVPVPRIVNLAIRWLLFRIMMGAGLIKLRSGDKKWWDLTTMHYFYETQPVPNPLTRYFHWMPKPWHKFEVLTNHFVELVAPWLLILPFLPPAIRRAGGLLQIVFQAVLITSGSLSFLNYLTIVPAIMCLDDAFVSRFFSTNTVAKASSAALAYTKMSPIRNAVTLGFGALIFTLSIPVVQNLLSSRQAMNSSFDPLRLVNSYGAFGVVTEDRDELIIKSSYDLEEWKEYEFQVKPGNIYKRPHWISPYHHRLDWQMWIACCGRSIERSPWIYRFLLKLLQGDQGVLRLMDGDPWAGKNEPPKYIRIDLYRYRFHKPREGTCGLNPYWDRKCLKQVYPLQGAATTESLKDEMKST